MLKLWGKKYEVIENDDNVVIKAFGSSPKELFSNIVSALASFQKPAPRLAVIKTKTKVPLFIESMDLNTMLVDFLEEILYLNESEQHVFHDVKFSKFDENKIEGRLLGLKVENFDNYVKGVNFEKSNIKQVSSKKWEAEVVLDL